jgi:excisionase family DNA binding protein
VEATRITLRLVTLRQAADITGLSTRTLRRAITGKRLGAHHLGRLVRIDVDELKRWVKADGAAEPKPPVR